MAEINPFNSTVAARTRAADQIVRQPDLLAVYEARGGLREDLVAIRDAGKRAELLSGAQSVAQAAGGAATSDVLTDFGALQDEYKSVMAVVKAVEGDLTRAGADATVLSAVERILVNEAEVSVRKVADGVDADGKAKTKRTRRAPGDAGGPAGGDRARRGGAGGPEADRGGVDEAQGDAEAAGGAVGLGGYGLFSETAQ